jgi:hypothetical protein
MAITPPPPKAKLSREGLGDGSETGFGVIKVLRTKVLKTATAPMECGRWAEESMTPLNGRFRKFAYVL